MAVVATLDVVLRALTRQFDAPLKKSSTLVGAFSKQLGGLSGVAATLGATQALSSAVTATRDFEKAFAKSTAIISDLSTEQRKQLEATARQVARATIFSATETAEAYFFLASAGLDATQSMQSLERVARFAEAGTFDLATATDLLTDAQSALGLTVDDAEENLRNMTLVSDTLVKANQLANATVQEFSEALTNKGAAAIRTYGLTLQDGVAALAAFADSGTKGSEAGTALDIVLRELTGTILRNRAEFKKHKITVFDSNGEFAGLSEVVRDVENALSGMSAEQRRVTLTQLGFNAKSLAFLNILTGTSSRMRRYREELGDVDGVTDAVAAKTIPAFERAMSSLQDVFESFSSNALVPILNNLGRFIELVNKAIDSVSGLREQLPSLPKILPATSSLILNTSSTFDRAFTALEKGELSGRRDLLDTLIGAPVFSNRGDSDRAAIRQEELLKKQLDEIQRLRRATESNASDSIVPASL